MTKNQHGGKRQNAGRPHRKDGRKLRIIKVALTENEFKLIKDILTTNDRRKALLDAVERVII